MKSSQIYLAGLGLLAAASAVSADLSSNPATDVAASSPAPSDPNVNAGAHPDTPCATETGSRVTTNCDTAVRVHSHEELESTGETTLGAALGRIDPSINYSRR